MTESRGNGDARVLEKAMDATGVRPMSNVDLLEGSVSRTLTKLTVPLVIGLFSSVIVYVVDIYFVSRLGVTALAGLGYAIPAAALVQTMLLGFGGGVATAIARSIGGGDASGARRITWHSTILALFLAAAFWTVGAWGMASAFAAMGASGEIRDLAMEFFGSWLWGAPFIALLQVVSAALRANGDTLSSGKLLLFATVINLLLDPILIFGWGPVPSLGLRGAGLATAAAYALTTIPASKWGAGLLGRSFSLEGFLDSSRSVLSVGAPAMLAYAWIQAGAAILMSVVSGYGAAAVAAFGVGMRLESMVRLVPMALAGSIEPFVGQNWSAGNHVRARAGVGASRRFTLAFGLVAWGTFALFAGPLATLFGGTGAVADDLKVLLWVLPAGYAAMGRVIVASAAFNAVGRGVLGSVLTLLRSLLFAVPFATYGGAHSLAGLFGGIAAANIVTELCAVAALRRFDLTQKRAAHRARHRAGNVSSSLSLDEDPGGSAPMTVPGTPAIHSISTARKSETGTADFRNPPLK
jgi:putative MATE family efflux protein